MFKRAFKIETRNISNFLNYLLPMQPSDTWEGLQHCRFDAYVSLIARLFGCSTCTADKELKLKVSKDNRDETKWLNESKFEEIKKMAQIGCRSIFTPLSLSFGDGGHSNYIYVELHHSFPRRLRYFIFEPHGSCAKWYTDVQQAVEAKLKTVFKEYNIFPSTSQNCLCSREGPQKIFHESKFHSDKVDGGYCAAFSLMYLTFQMANQSLSLETFEDLFDAQFDMLGDTKQKHMNLYMRRFVGMCESMIPATCYYYTLADFERYITKALDCLQPKMIHERSKKLGGKTYGRALQRRRVEKQIEKDDPRT